MRLLLSLLLGLGECVDQVLMLNGVILVVVAGVSILGDIARAIARLDLRLSPGNVSCWLSIDHNLLLGRGKEGLWRPALR